MKRFAMDLHDSDWNARSMETRASTSERALRVMVLHDALEAGIVAKGIHDRICARLPAGTSTRLSLWPFASLADSKAQPLACGDITEADVLIIAADGAQALPNAVQRRLEKCLAAREPMNFGLAAVLYGVQEDKKEMSPAHSYLEALAAKIGAEFFCQAIASPAQNGSSLSTAVRPLAIDFLLEGDSFSASVSIDHWGLNE